MYVAVCKPVVPILIVPPSSLSSVNALAFPP
jgi:hypothetical protein